jgi:hypothetical protein
MPLGTCQTGATVMAGTLMMRVISSVICEE